MFFCCSTYLSTNIIHEMFTFALNEIYIQAGDFIRSLFEACQSHFLSQYRFPHQCNIVNSSGIFVTFCQFPQIQFYSFAKFISFKNYFIKSENPYHMPSTLVHLCKSIQSKFQAPRQISIRVNLQ